MPLARAISCRYGSAPGEAPEQRIEATVNCILDAVFEQGAVVVTTTVAQPIGHERIANEAQRTGERTADGRFDHRAASASSSMDSRLAYQANISSASAVAIFSSACPA